MKRIWIIFALTVLFCLPTVSTMGQTRPSQRLPRTIKATKKERREAIQAQQLVEEGAQLLKEGNARLAGERFRRALQLAPDNGHAHSYLAQIAWNEHRPEIARRHAELALQYNPKNARAHYVMGQVLLKEGRSLAAFEHLRKAADAVPDERERVETKSLLSRLRENHPAWFSKTKQPVPVVDPKAVDPAAPKSETAPMRPNLAVFTFDETSPQIEMQGWGDSITEMLTTTLINSGRYRIIERKQLHKVLEEQALGQSGALDAETAVVVGKIMGLDAIVVGSISQLNNALETDARILNVETGEAMTAAHAGGGSADHLRQMAETLAHTIVGYAGSVPVRTPADTLDNSPH